uniref:ribonuclease H n=1 Tax=Lepisosteus oculatus TaxID=7918 RepID=W5MQY1_LEPOC
PDDIPAEVWKILGRQGADILVSLFNRITDEGAVPPIWVNRTTVPIWKGKGDVMECSNYRPILLCHAMKIFELVLDARLGKPVSVTMNQYGFVKGCGTTDAIHALLEKHREKNKSVHMEFLDLEKAFEQVPHEFIWHALRLHSVHEAYLLYRNVTSVIQGPVGTSQPFAINVGVHQGSSLSPLFFVLCMVMATANLQAPYPWSLLYADDFFLGDEECQELQHQMQRWKIRLDEHGMRLNTKKTEYMECDPKTDGTIGISGEDLNLKFLGSIISGELARANAAWMKWCQVTGVCDHRIPIGLKAKVYKTVVRPVALHGSECWPATSRHEQALHVMEMRMIQWCLGLTRFDHVFNDDVCQRMGVAPIMENMREGRLRWYGHVMRSGEHIVARTAMRQSPQGRRPQEQPKKRWMDRITEDMQKVNVAPEDTCDPVQWREESNQITTS